MPLMLTIACALYIAALPMFDMLTPILRHAPPVFHGYDRLHDERWYFHTPIVSRFR